MSYKRAVITEELVALTQDTLSALILRQCIYWSTRVQDFNKYIEEVQQHKIYNSAEEKAQEDQVIDSLKHNGWFFKKAGELKEEIMVDKSINTIRRKIRHLIDQGWLEQRRNPNNPWDKVLQYRVNLAQIEADLRELDYTLATVMGADYSKVKDAIATALDDQESKPVQCGESKETKAEEQKLEKSGQSSIARDRETGKNRAKRVKQEKQEAEKRRFDVIPDDQSQQLEEQPKQETKPETKETEIMKSETYPEPDCHERRISKQEEPKQDKPFQHKPYDLDQAQESEFLQLCVNYKCDKEKKMEESRALCIMQAMINRLKDGTAQAKDYLMLDWYKDGKLDIHKNPQQSDYERWKRVDEMIAERERMEERETRINPS